MTSPYPWHYTLRWPLYYQWPSAKNHTRMEIRPDRFTFHQPQKGDARLLFCGDIMISNGDRIPLLHPELVDLIQSSDLFIGNCEAPLSEKSLNSKARYLFNFDMAQCYLRSIIDQCGLPTNKWVLSMANNHTGDQHMAGCLKTYDILTEMGITAIGRFENVLPLKIIQSGEFRIGFVAWTEWMNCEIFSSDDPGAFRRDHIVKHNWKRIKELYHLDYLIGLPHWEYEFQHFPKKETRALAKHLINDLGIDFLIGIHTHTLQTMEWFDHGYCAYNLGNFYGQGRAWPVKLIPILEIGLQRDENNKCRLSHYQLHYFYQMSDTPQDQIIPLHAAPAKERARIGKRIKKLYVAHDSLDEIMK